MTRQTCTRGECAALMLVGQLARGHIGDTAAMTQLQGRARALLRALATPAAATEPGTPCTVRPETLRRIALLHAAKRPQKEIAKLAGVSRFLVGFHLRPSRAMINACLNGEPEAWEVAR